MEAAINNFQKNLFLLLLYSSGFSGVVLDILAAGGSKTALYVVFDTLIVMLAVLSLSWIRSGLAYIVLFLIACFIFNASYSEAPLLASLNGYREILILFCLVIFYNKIFSQPDEGITREYIGIVKKYSILFLALNLPVAAVQFAKHGASDWVGGVYGNLGSGILTLSILCLVFFMSGYTRTVGERALLYVALIPLTLNETKVSFILIPITIVLIHFEPKVKNIVAGAVMAVLFVMVLNLYYTDKNKSAENNIAHIFSSDFIDDYLFGDIYYSTDVPRFTKIIVAWQLLQQEINYFLFGFEYGIFKGGTVVEGTRLSLAYQWLLVGTRPYLFFMMIQGGIMLVSGVFLLIAYINKFFREANKFKTFLLIIFTIMLFYNDSFRNQGFCTIYFFLVFYANSSFYDEKMLKTA